MSLQQRGGGNLQTRLDRHSQYTYDQRSTPRPLFQVNRVGRCRWRQQSGATPSTWVQQNPAAMHSKCDADAVIARRLCYVIRVIGPGRPAAIPFQPHPGVPIRQHPQMQHIYRIIWRRQAASYCTSCRAPDASLAYINNKQYKQNNHRKTCHRAAE